MANHICHNRYGTFYFRFIIPLAFRKHFQNKREIRYSLKTDSKKLAIRRARLYRVHIDSLLEQLEDMSKGTFFTTQLMTFTTLEGRKKEVDLGDVAKEMQVIAAWERQDEERAKNAGHTPPELMTHGNNNTSETWENYSSKYLKVVLGTKRDLVQDTLDGCQASYNLLPFILGANRSLQSFTNDDMEALYEGLRILPIRFKSQTSPYKDLSFVELKMLDIATNKLRSIRTINQDYGRIKTVFAKATKDGIIERNVADSVEYIKDPKTNKKRRSLFDADDLRKIFTHPHFTENKWRKVAQTRTPDPYTFWLFPLALFTGARMNELLQLEKQNIVQFGDGWYLDIKNEFHPETGKKTKSVKNKNSIRQIPLSDTLINMGFLKFVNDCRTKAIFPEVSDRKTGKKAAQKQLAYRLKAMDVYVTGQKTFHSLRHTFITHALTKKAEIPYLAGVTGHLDTEEKNISPVLKDVYFKGYPIDILKKEVIDKLDYDVDFSHVKWPYL